MYNKKIMHSKPDFKFENKLWETGTNTVIGIDEVGRGSLAGPVVAGAAFAKAMAAKAAILKLGIDDSKRLTSITRIMLKPVIEQYFYTGIGISSVAEINELGIVKATHLAMKRAVIRIMNTELGIKKDSFYFLIDGYPVKGLPGGVNQQTAIIKGDRKSISIAAASIIAKVFRDNLMIEISGNYPMYKWDLNKGYGTYIHRSALKSYGKTCQHRLLFVDSLI